MKLLFATGNQYKYNLMKERLKEFSDIEVIIPKMLGININIIEDGKTPEENAIKKATQYFKAIHLPTIAEDSGLYIDEFSVKDQPGLFVRRINGKEDTTDEEILNYYIEKLNKYNGKSLACYHTGVCIIDESGNIYSNTIEENKFLMTVENNDLPTISGGILDCISYDLVNKKYFNERTEEDKAFHYKKIDDTYKNMISKIFY